MANNSNTTQTGPTDAQRLSTLTSSIKDATARLGNSNRGYLSLVESSRTILRNIGEIFQLTGGIGSVEEWDRLSPARKVAIGAALRKMDELRTLSAEECKTEMEDAGIESLLTKFNIDGDLLPDALVSAAGPSTTLPAPGMPSFEGLALEGFLPGLPDSINSPISTQLSQVSSQMEALFETLSTKLQIDKADIQGDLKGVHGQLESMQTEIRKFHEAFAGILDAMNHLSSQVDTLSAAALTQGELDSGEGRSTRSGKRTGTEHDVVTKKTKSQ